MKKFNLKLKFVFIIRVRSIPGPYYDLFTTPLHFTSMTTTPDQLKELQAKKEKYKTLKGQWFTIKKSVSRVKVYALIIKPKDIIFESEVKDNLNRNEDLELFVVLQHPVSQTVMFTQPLEEFLKDSSK